jgi:hypothetical protein
MRGKLLDVELPCHSHLVQICRIILLFNLSRVHTQYANIMTDRDICVSSTHVHDFTLWNNLHKLRFITSRTDILGDSMHHQHERKNDTEADHDLTTGVRCAAAVGKSGCVKLRSKSGSIGNRFL